MVAVLKSSGDPEIRPGDVGTVVELLPFDSLEVEFLDRDGRTRYVGTLSADDMLLLKRERTRVPWISQPRIHATGAKESRP